MLTSTRESEAKKKPTTKTNQQKNLQQTYSYKPQKPCFGKAILVWGKVLVGFFYNF